MSTEETLAPEAAQPEQQPAELAQPQTEAEGKPEGQADAAEEEHLSAEQRRIRQQDRRIARLTAGRGAAQREAELLREQLAQLQQKPQGQEDEQTAQQRDREALEAELERRLTQRERLKETDRWAEKVVAAGRKLDGFEQAVQTVMGEVPLFTRSGEPTAFTEALQEADHPEQLLHWLGNNPDEAAKFAGLSPAQTGRLLAKLEVQMEREAKAKTSAAPKPLEPVKPAASQDKDLADMSYAEFVKARKAQLKR